MIFSVSALHVHLKVSKHSRKPQMNDWLQRHKIRSVIPGKNQGNLDAKFEFSFSQATRRSSSSFLCIFLLPSGHRKSSFSVSSSDITLFRRFDARSEVKNRIFLSEVTRRSFFVSCSFFSSSFIGASKEFLQRFIVGRRFVQAFRSDYSMLPRSSSSPCHLLSKFSRQLLWQRALNKRLRIWMHMYACHLTMFLWSACVAWVWGSLSPSFVHLWDFAFLLVRNRKWFISSEENDNQWMEDIQSIFRDAQFMFFLCHSCERFDLNNKWMSW